MIAAYSPQARGRSERSFGTWQGRLPQELASGAIYREFNVSAAEKGTAFRRTSRADLNRVFTVQTERVVAKDNTVAVGNRLWQVDKTRFRNTLAGSTVTIHEHMDQTVSIRFDGAGARLTGTATQKRRGKDGSMETAKTKIRFPPLPTAPFETRAQKERSGSSA
jgi:hypothetical protein